LSDNVWKRDEVDSPCLKVCVMHPDAQMCIGCNRSIEEITDWSQMTGDERVVILQELPGRKVSAAKRRGGRAARLQRS
jgi:predicted Fe-S protein YdhL (DUF1289 family)